MEAGTVDFGVGNSLRLAFGLDTFHRHTADCVNIVALPGYSPTDLTDWNLPLDIYFDDSVHTNPVFRQNLEFWLQHVKPNGILCGHDHSSQFPDIVNEVTALAQRIGASVEVVGAIWKIELPPAWRRDNKSAVEIPRAPFVQTPLAISAAPPLPSHIGTMMKPEELNLLYGLARHHYQGHGEIIDFGPFLGSSTFMLVEGLRANSRLYGSGRRIFSFDRFVYEPYKGFDIFLNEKDLPTRSFFQNYLVNLKEQIANVYCSPGDLLTFSWNQHPIEILFVDLAKSVELNNHLIRQFFGALIPQHSIVVQQDYFYYGCPWIAIAMEHFADWLDYVGCAMGATAYFQARAKIPQILVRTPIDVANNPARQIRLLERAGRAQSARPAKLSTLHAPIIWVLWVWVALHFRCSTRSTGSGVPDDWSSALDWNMRVARREMAARGFFYCATLGCTSWKMGDPGRLTHSTGL